MTPNMVIRRDRMRMEQLVTRKEFEQVLIHIAKANDEMGHVQNDIKEIRMKTDKFMEDLSNLKSDIAVIKVSLKGIDTSTSSVEKKVDSFDKRVWGLLVGVGLSLLTVLLHIISQG